MKRDKILIVNLYPTSYPGGVERILATMATILSKSGYTVDFLTEERLSPWQSRVMNILDHFKLKEVAINIFFAHELKHCEDYAAVISNGFYGINIRHKHCIHIYHGTIAGFRRAIAGHLSLTSLLRLRSIEVLERLSGHGKTIVAVSDYCSRELSKYYGLQASYVIKDIVDTSFFSPSSMEELQNNKRSLFGSDLPVVIFIGRPEYAKGGDILDEVIRLSEKRYNFLICAGKIGKAYRIEEASNVIIRVGLSPEIMRDAYRSADVSLLPSRYEGYGLAVAEAMASGVPVVGNSVGLMADIRRKDPLLGGYILSPDAAPSAYLEGIDKAVADRERLSARSRDYILHDNDPEGYGRQWRWILSA